jgi:hypothetical protein
MIEETKELEEARRKLIFKAYCWGVANDYCTGAEMLKTKNEVLEELLEAAKTYYKESRNQILR